MLTFLVEIASRHLLYIFFFKLQPFLRKHLKLIVLILRILNMNIRLILLSHSNPPLIRILRPPMSLLIKLFRLRCLPIKLYIWGLSSAGLRVSVVVVLALFLAEDCGVVLSVGLLLVGRVLTVHDLLKWFAVGLVEVVLAGLFVLCAAWLVESIHLNLLWPLFPSFLFCLRLLISWSNSDAIYTDADLLWLVLSFF